MIKTASLLCLAMTAALLGGCHRGQDISFDGRSITLHASGKPAATITSRGSFSVGPKLVDISPDQRQVLIRYYDNVVAIHRDAEAMEKAGLSMAGKAVDVAGHSIGSAVGLASASTAARDARTADLQDRGRQMQQTALRLCDRIRQTGKLQATMATRINAFKPYAGINPAPGVHCST